MEKYLKIFNPKDTWKYVAVFGTVLVVIKGIIGQDPVWDSVFIIFFSFLCAFSIALGVYLHRPHPIRGWYILAIAQFFESIGNIFFTKFFYLDGGNKALTFVIIFYALGGLFFLLGMLSMIKLFRNEISSSTILNGLIITMATGIFIWVLRIRNDLIIPTQTMDTILLAIFLAVVAGIVFMLSLFVMMRSGQITAIYFLFGAGIVIIIGILNYFKLYGWTSHYFILDEMRLMANIDLFYPVGYLLISIAFLHPSLSKFRENQLFLRIDANRYIINILGISFLLIPVTFLIQYFQGSQVNDLLFIVSVSVVFILVFLQVRNLSRTYYQVKDKNQELNNQNEMLKTLANIDHVTKLFNRKFLFEYGEQAIKNALFVKKRLAFALISLDDVQYIYSHLSRQEIDQVLLDISNSFLRIKRKDDIVIRYGDSEFVIIFDDIREELDFEGLMARFRENTKLPVTIDDKEFTVSFSTGIAFLPDDGTDVNALVEKADEALTEAKHNGYEQIRTFSKLTKPELSNI